MTSTKIVRDGNIIRPPDFNFEYDPKLSAGTIIYNEMQKHGYKIAQYIAETGETDTFSALLQRSTRVALKMKDMGLSKGDIISICSHNHLNNSATFIAATFLGVVNASLDPSLSVQDTAHLVQQVKPKIIFASPEAIDLIEKSLKVAENDSARIVIFGEHHTQHLSFEEFLEPHKEEKNFRPNPSIPLDDTMIILFSSGTTGTPKGICLSGYACLCTANQTWYFTEYDGSILLYSTLYWISSCLYLYLSLLFGVPRVLCRKFDKAEIWKYVVQYKVCFTFITPFLASEISKTELPPKADLPKFHYILIGGGVASEDVVRKLKKLLPDTLVAQAYGQSEVGFISGFAYKRDKELSDRKPKSSGKPMDGILFKIVDPVTQEILRPDQRGELCLKTKKQFSGYHNRDSSGAFDKDGWVKTGDIAYFDEDFCIYVIDRIKELLRYRSVNVIPTVLEDVLVKHPAVKSAVVIGIPHEIDGDHPMAIVVLKDGHANICSEEIEEFLAGNVHEMQQLRAGVKFVKEIPLTPTHKINRRMLRDMVLSGKI